MKNKRKNIPVLVDPIDICNALVGLKDVRILYYQRPGPEAILAVEQVTGDVGCPRCKRKARVKNRPWITYFDLPFGGVPTRLLWRKHRMACVNKGCPVKTFTLSDHRIAAKGCFITTRAAKWATKQVGMGRTVSEVAQELGCDWGVVNKAVSTYGKALLAADRSRLKETKALGLDETLFGRQGRYKERHYCTSVADVGNNQLIDILPTRDYVGVAEWVLSKPHHFRHNLEYGALDMSNTYAAVYSVTLPKVTQVVDRFHLIKLANQALDAIRRRVQQEQLRHRGRRDDPLYKSRKLLLMRSDRLDEATSNRLESLLQLGDPDAEVALAYRIKEAICDFYEINAYIQAEEHLRSIVVHAKKKSMPAELRRFARTVDKWFDKIMAFHLARVTNGPTEGLNNLIKRIKRVGFGFTNFENYRIRALLYAGKPNWRVLDSIVVT